MKHYSSPLFDPRSPTLSFFLPPEDLVRIWGTAEMLERREKCSSLCLNHQTKNAQVLSGVYSLQTELILLKKRPPLVHSLAARFNLSLGQSLD